jgi:hypothetical protein
MAETNPLCRNAFRGAKTQLIQQIEANMAQKIPATPKGTGPSGTKLWRDVLSKYELEEHELALLREMLRTVDLLDKLAAITAREGLMVKGSWGSKPHPAVTESRQQKIALARLTAALRLPAGDENDQAAGRRPQRRVGVRGVYGVRAVVS